jgi:hypothetical protein
MEFFLDFCWHCVHPALQIAVLVFKGGPMLKKLFAKMIPQPPEIFKIED